MIKRGEIYFAALDKGVGSEQRGYRPIIVLQNNVGNEYSPTIIIAPLTSKPKRHYPTHVEIKKYESGMIEDSMVLLEQIHTIDKIRLGPFIGCATDEVMKKIESAILLSLGIINKGV